MGERPVTQGIPIRALAVSVLVLRPGPGGPHVLLLCRAEEQLPGVWSVVTGSVEAGERGWQAALREMAEETGLAPLELYNADLCQQFYEPEIECIVIAPVFVAFVAAGAEPHLNHEHSEYTWATLAEATALLPFAGQRRNLAHVWAEFVDRPPLEYLRIPPPGSGAG